MELTAYSKCKNTVLTLIAKDSSIPWEADAFKSLSKKIGLQCYHHNFYNRGMTAFIETHAKVKSYIFAASKTVNFVQYRIILQLACSHVP